MSIHAIRPETEMAVRRQRRTSFITSSVIAVLVVLLLAILSFFLLSPLFKESPVLVSYQSGSLQPGDRGGPESLHLHRPQAFRSLVRDGQGHRRQHRTWVAGDEVIMAKSKKAAEVKGSGGTFDWVSGGSAHDWKTKGRKQKADWLAVSPAKRSKSLKLVDNTVLVYGTNWEPAPEMALAMAPAP